METLKKIYKQKYDSKNSFHLKDKRSLPMQKYKNEK